MATKYPCVEYLLKTGFDNFVMRKVRRYPLYNTINWKGKSLLEVMRLDKSEFRALMDHSKDVDLFLLRSYHWFKKRGMRLNFDDARRLWSFPEKEAQSIIKRSGVSINDAAKYVLKQLNRSSSKNIYSADSDVLRDWGDYLEDCIKLEMDLNANAVIFPNNLHAAHQKTIKKVKYKEDKELSEKIESLFSQLQEQFYFEADTFLIRPIKDAAELFAEAKALSHCVGGYAKKHAAGKVTILVVRRKDEPDKPFYTAEISEQTVMQCRGFKNCSMTDDVNQFISDFANSKLKKQPAKQMRGVAV